MSVRSTIIISQKMDKITINTDMAEITDDVSAEQNDEMLKEFHRCAAQWGIDIHSKEFNPTSFFAMMREKEKSETSKTPAQEQKVVKKSTQASSRSKRTATESKRDTGVTVVTSEEVGSALKIIAAIHGKTLSTFLNDFIEASFADEIKIVAKLKKLKT